MHKNLSSASLIHVADPMCSWCYAFEPELEKVSTSTGLGVRLVMGGLYVDHRTVALDDAMRTYLRETWGRVSALSGQPVSLRGKVVKFNANILGTNWLHIQDGSGSAADASNDLTVTSAAQAAVGDTVVVTGNVALDKDFGSGYSYPVLVEDASLTVE